ncbi:MAG: phosphopantothenate synthase [Micavibrio sp.]|nr:MAG: phosphopantothenate synthase [Micavibrio sp.]
MQSLENKNILLIISGGVAAYKSLELIRLIKKAGANVRCILTESGTQFITPLSVASLSEEQVYTDLFSLKDETEMGHIRLSREADLIIVAPASANLIAKTAHGRADDLASTTLLASDKPVLIAPAMNPEMWDNEATQDNIQTLEQRGITLIGPAQGDTACGETGTGRMSEPEEIFGAILSFFYERPLKSFKALVTAGPTYEPIDPVRFVGNRSSGKQGYAIATALFEAGADVTLISGPTALPGPVGIKTIRVETAQQMLKACQSALPADIAICAAAVSDWAPKENKASKIKKRRNHTPPSIALKENPDILARLAKDGPNRPDLVIGFAAETEDIIINAREKLARKNCDLMIANKISAAENVFGSNQNHVHLVSLDDSEEWPRASKKTIARKLAQRIAQHINNKEKATNVRRIEAAE